MVNGTTRPCYFPLPGGGLILIPATLSPTEQRCLLAHKLAHHELGHVPTGDVLEEWRMHVEAERWAALHLIPCDALAEACAQSPDPEQIASRLGVTRRMLRTRMDCALR